MSSLLAFAAVGARAILDVFVVGQLISSAMPLERLVALWVADAAFAFLFEHRACGHVDPGVLSGSVALSTITTVED